MSDAPGGDEIRAAVYAAIKNAVKERSMRMYRNHPNWLGDARSLENIDVTMSILRDVFDVLDHYDLVPRERLR